MKKVISVSKVWRCENADMLAPICWEGYCILFNDNTCEIVDKYSEVECRKANEQEKKDFARRLGYVFEGDTVEIVKGRKLPIGEHKIVKNTYRYDVPNTYGHCYTDYFVFTDGTKTNVENVKQINVNSFSKDTYLRFAKEIPSFYRGGRI